MKATKDGEVPDRCYYYLLDWKDSNMEEFWLLTRKQKVSSLTTEEFWVAFDYAVMADKIFTEAIKTIKP